MCAVVDAIPTSFRPFGRSSNIQASSLYLYSVRNRSAGSQFVKPAGGGASNSIHSTNRKLADKDLLLGRAGLEVMGTHSAGPQRVRRCSFLLRDSHGGYSRGYPGRVKGRVGPKNRDSESSLRVKRSNLALPQLDCHAPFGDAQGRPVGCSQ